MWELFRTDADAPSSGGSRHAGWSWEREGEHGAVLTDYRSTLWRLRDFRHSRPDFMALAPVAVGGLPESLRTPDDEVPENLREGYGWVYGSTMPRDAHPPGVVG